MKTFTNTHTLLYHTNDSISIPLRYSIIEGTTWFIGKDVAAICGYKDTWRAIKYHVSPENIDHIILDGHKHIIINFSGFEQLAPDKKPVNWFVNNNIATFTEEKSVSEPPTVFTHPQFGTVRTVEIDNEVWFVGKDVAEALGYSDPTLAAGRHASQTLDYSGKKNPNYGNTTLSQKYKADPAYSKEKQSRPGGQNGRAIPVCLLDKDKNVIATFPYMQLCAEYVLKQLHSSSSPAGLAGRIPYYIETGNIYKHTYYFSKDNTVLSLNNEKSSTTIESIA